MRWITLADLPPEDLKSESSADWAIHPRFCRIEWEEGEKVEGWPDDKLVWTVGLFHRHWLSSKSPPDPPDVFRCGLINREEVRGNKPKAFPEYACDKCGKNVPKNVVEEKIERQLSLKGVDPRNDRRGAVLATRKNNLIDTKES